MVVFHKRQSDLEWGVACFRPVHLSNGNAQVEPSNEMGLLSNQNGGLASNFLAFAWINICKQWEQMVQKHAKVKMDGKKGPTHLETSTLQHIGKPGNQELVFNLRL